MRKFFKILFLCILLLLTSCKEAVVHDLSEQEANKILSALVVDGLMAEKARQSNGKWSIKVDSKEVLRAVQLIDSRRLIRIEPKNTRDSSSLLVSKDEEKRKHELALAQDLEFTIRDIPNVIGARVHVNLPSFDPIWGKTKNSDTGSASILVIYRVGAAISQDQIATLVAGASGIKREQVSVVLTPGEMPEQGLEVLPVSSNSSERMLASYSFGQEKSTIQKNNILSYLGYQEYIGILFILSGFVWFLWARRKTKPAPLLSQI